MMLRLAVYTPSLLLLNSWNTGFMPEVVQVWQKARVELPKFETLLRTLRYACAINLESEKCTQASFFCTTLSYCRTFATLSAAI